MFVAALLALALPACAPAIRLPARAMPVVVQLSWTHQAQFAGFYAAEQQGYYAAEGLAVAFKEAVPTTDPQAAVLDGTAHFGLTAANNLIVARAQGRLVRAIAVIYRRNARVYVALADSGITRPQDFVDKTVAIGTIGRPMLATLLNSVGVRLDQCTVVDQPANLGMLYAGQVDVQSVFLTNEVLTAQREGHKLNIIYPDDYGIHFYADTLFSSDDFIARNPDVVKRFLRASLKGWEYALTHAGDMGALVQTYRPAADAGLESAKMAASLPLVNTGEDRIGWMRAETWTHMEQTLRAQGALTQTLDISQVYTMQFVEEVYGK